MAKNGGSFLSSAPVKFLLGLLFVVALLAGGAYALLYGATHPPRDRTRLDPSDLLLRAEDVTFRATDGVLLSGWMIKGAPRAPVIVLCHDLGGSRSSLLNSAVSLNRAGYSLLLFDFRGHGLSSGTGGYLGVDEKRDIQGALEFLKSRNDVDGTRVGLWGIGMGAYAGALAAIESPEVVALALDSLYPDVESQMDRLLRTKIPPVLSFLMPALHVAYRPYLALRPAASTSLQGALGGLAGKNVLLIVASDPGDLYQEGQALYAALPEGPRGGKNLLVLKASAVTGLYAEDKKTYDQAIVRFFTTNLPKEATKPREQKKVVVQER